ncbi:MAG: hypothetical protein WDO70_00550 [Alphaproteobacteria bacterium]
MILILLLIPALLLRPAPAYALMPMSAAVGVGVPPVCNMGQPDAGQIRAAATDATAVIAQITSIATSMGLSMAAEQSALAGTLQVMGMAVEKAAEKNLEAKLTAGGISAVRQIKGAKTVNMESKNCRIHTGNKISHTVSAYSRTVAMTLEGKEITQFFGGNPEMRLSVTALQRLCRNGQLAPNDLGLRWFVDNGCFSDPSSVHDFLKASTILDNPVLLMPSANQMNCLENPNDPVACVGSPQAVWRSLNDKQRRYVGAVRYCETLEGGHSATMDGITGDVALSPLGMAAAMAKFASFAKVTTATDVCRAELARRTAADVEAILATVATDPAMRDMQNNAPRIMELLSTEGDDMAPYKARKCETVPYGTTYVGPASAGTSFQVVDCPSATDFSPSASPTAKLPHKVYLSQYVLDRYARDFCMSREAAASNYVDTGTDTEKTGNILDCNIVASLWDQHEIESKHNFVAVVRALQGIGRNIGATPAAPIKASRYEAPGGDGDLRREVAWDQDNEHRLLKPVALRVGSTVTTNALPGIPVQ